MRSWKWKLDCSDLAILAVCVVEELVMLDYLASLIWPIDMIQGPALLYRYLLIWKLPLIVGGVVLALGRPAYLHFQSAKNNAQRVKALESELAGCRRNHRRLVNELLQLLRNSEDRRKKDVALGARFVRELSMQRSGLALTINKVVLPALRDSESDFGCDSRNRTLVEEALGMFFRPLDGEDLRRDVETTEEIVEKFTEFLDEVSPDDFQQEGS